MVILTEFEHSSWTFLKMWDLSHCEGRMFAHGVSLRPPNNFTNIPDEHWSGRGWETGRAGGPIADFRTVLAWGGTGSNQAAAQVPLPVQFWGSGRGNPEKAASALDAGSCSPELILGRMKWGSWGIGWCYSTVCLWWPLSQPLPIDAVTRGAAAGFF